MDPDATLEWILRLRDALDDAIEGGRAVDPDRVYSLVGLVDELDAWLREGRRPPSRWRASLEAQPALLVLDGRDRASNDDAPARRRRALVRRRRAPLPDQLPLPFRASGAR